MTADEVAPHLDHAGFLNLWCTAEINGVEVGRDLLSNMAWTIGALIAYASRDAHVVAGDAFGSGTVGNGGCLAELWGRRGQQTPPPLRPAKGVEPPTSRFQVTRPQRCAHQQDACHRRGKPAKSCAAFPPTMTIDETL